MKRINIRNWKKVAQNRESWKKCLSKAEPYIGCSALEKEDVVDIRHLKAFVTCKTEPRFCIFYKIYIWWVVTFLQNMGDRDYVNYRTD